MEKYYKVNKEIAIRAGLDEQVRNEENGKLILSTKDIRNIPLTLDERVSALGIEEYVEPETTEE